MRKYPSGFILTSTGNFKSGKEYDIIFVSVISGSVIFVSVVKLLHSRLLTKSEPTFHFISPDTTPPAIVRAFVPT